MIRPSRNFVQSSASASSMTTGWSSSPSFRLLPLLLLITMIDNYYNYQEVHAFTINHHHHHSSMIPLRKPSAGSLLFIPSAPHRTPPSRMRMSTVPTESVNTDNNNHQLNDELDRILTISSSSSAAVTTSPSPLRQAITFLQEHSHEIQLNKSNWDHIFTTIEELTAALAVDMTSASSSSSTRNADTTTSTVEFPMQSTIRQDMTDMYQLLATLPLMMEANSTTTTVATIPDGATMEPTLRLFGAVSTTDPPASYIPMNPNTGNNNNYIISPQLFEQILNVPMSSLTPSSSNTLLYVGIAVAIVEGILSLYTGINYNLIVGCTLLFVLLDRVFLNGISMETIFKVISPELQQRIYHHEAGHFLCAYLLGCPIESIVVSAYAALQDPRFRYRPSFTAGTSFFDPILSEQMNASMQPSKATSGVTRSSIDRYSMIVMAGIAAEADQYGQADGGASDEYALIAFLSQLRSNQRNRSNDGGIGTWNSEQIRNQARYGAVQAMLLLRQYRPAYEALVQALQYGGTLKDCIYAIEQAGRKHQLPTRNDRQPVGYIVNNNISNEVTSAWIPNTHNNTFIHNLLVRK